MNRLTTAQAADAFGVSPATYRKMVKRGTAPQPVERIDERTPLYDAEEVTNWARGYVKGARRREQG